MYTTAYRAENRIDYILWLRDMMREQRIRERLEQLAAEAYRSAREAVAVRTRKLGVLHWIFKWGLRRLP